MSPGTVLLVEDNEDNAIIYRTILEYHGFSVLTAVDGESAVRIARERKPDVILMDVSIPIMDGWRATQVLKAGEDTKAIPVIALTAHALAPDRKKAIEVGCDDYIAKPADPATVLEVVRRWTHKEVSKNQALRGADL